MSVRLVIMDPIDRKWVCHLMRWFLTSSDIYSSIWSTEYMKLITKY